MKSWFRSSMPAPPSALPAQPLTPELAQDAVDMLHARAQSLRVALGRSDIEQVVWRMGLERYRSGQRLSFHARTPQHARILLVLHGEASFYALKLPAESLRVVESTVSRGYLVGLVDLFSGSSPASYAEVTEPVVAGSLSLEALDNLAEHQPKMAYQFNRLLLSELAFIAREHARRRLALGQVARSMRDELDSAFATDEHLLGMQLK